MKLLFRMRAGNVLKLFHERKNKEQLMCPSLVTLVSLPLCYQKINQLNKGK